MQEATLRRPRGRPFNQLRRAFCRGSASRPLDRRLCPPARLAASCCALRVSQWLIPPRRRERLARAPARPSGRPGEAEALVMAGNTLGLLGRDSAAGVLVIRLRPKSSTRLSPFLAGFRSYKGGHEAATDSYVRQVLQIQYPVKPSPRSQPSSQKQRSEGGVAGGARPPCWT
jgi:hypothetical protein